MMGMGVTLRTSVVKLWGGPLGVLLRGVIDMSLEVDLGEHLGVTLGQSSLPPPPPLPPVLIHMSMGFMMLALTMCLILVATMALSFCPVFRRLNKTDLIFSLLSFSIGKCGPGGRGALPKPSICALGGGSQEFSALRSPGSVSDSFSHSSPSSVFLRWGE